MATLVKSVKILHASASASMGFSSAKLTYSSVSSIPAHWRSQGFELLNLNPMFGPSRAYKSLNRSGEVKDQEDNEIVLAKRKRVMEELARSKKEIKQLRANISSTWKNLSTVLNSLKELDKEPEPKNQSAPAEDKPHESQFERTPSSRGRFN